MSKALNFNKVKKAFLPVTLPDENETTLMILTPTKSIMNVLVNLEKDLKESDDETGADVLYEACSLIMSRNKTGRKVTVKELEDLLDVEDMFLFINTYTDFIGELTNSKN